MHARLYHPFWTSSFAPATSQSSTCKSLTVGGGGPMMYQFAEPPTLSGLLPACGMAGAVGRESDITPPRRLSVHGYAGPSRHAPA